MAGNPSFKQKKNIIAISAFVEKSCGVVVHTKNGVSYGPNVNVNCWGETKTYQTSRPLAE